MRRLRGCSRMSDLKCVCGAARKLRTHVLDQRPDFERRFQACGGKSACTSLVSPLRAAKVALGGEASDQESVGFLAQRIECDQSLGERRAALAGTQEPQHERPRDVAQTLPMPAEPFAERLPRPQRKVFQQGSAIERERFRGAARIPGGGAEAGDVDVDAFRVERHCAARRQRRDRRGSAAQGGELLAKRGVRLFASARPNELGETLAGERKPFGKSEAGEDGHRLPARKRDAPAVDAAQLEGAKQAQLHHQRTQTSMVGAIGGRKHISTRLKPRVDSPSKAARPARRRSPTLFHTHFTSPRFSSVTVSSRHAPERVDRFSRGRVPCLERLRT